MRLNTPVGALLLVSACTGTIGGDMDDVPPPPQTDVQMVVRDGALPLPNVRVLFQHGDDSLIAEVLTDAEGRAVAEMPEGGTVTVVRTFPPAMIIAESRPAEIYSYVGVKGGDRLVLSRPTNDGPANAINVMVPETADGTVQIHTPCGSGQGTGPLIPITTRGCGAEVPFYVMDGNGDSFVKRAPYSENVDLSMESLSAQLSSTVSATNVPLDTTVTVEKRIELDGYAVYSSGAKRVDQTPATIDVPNLTGVDQLLVAAITTNNRTQMVARREVFENTPSIVDASVGLIPSIAGQPIYAPTGVSWVEEGPGLADAVVATLLVTRPQSGAEPSPLDQYIRAVVAPHAGTSLRVPTLPGAIDAIYNPRATDDIGGAIGVVAVPGGYDGMRAKAFTVDSVVHLAPTNGAVTLSYAGVTPPGF